LAAALIFFDAAFARGGDGHWRNPMELISKLSENRRTPRSVHRLSLYAGLALMLMWFAYASFLIITNLEFPDADETMDLVGVALVMFGLGWAAVRLGALLIGRIHRRIVSG
jgi:hypothetical protein